MKKIKLFSTNRSIGSIEDITTEGSRSVDLVWTTGHKGLRTTRDGFQYFEELAVDEKSIDLSQMIGNPLLDSHNGDSLRSIIGVIENVKIDPIKSEGRATVRFAKDAYSEEVFQKVKDGIIRNTSVGYRINDFKNVSNKEDEIPTYRANSWTPYEISLVGIGFDPHSNIRSDEETTEIEVTQNEIKTVSENETINLEETRKMTEEQLKALEAEKLKAVKEAKEQEKKRQDDIRLAVRSAKLEESFAQECIDKDLGADKVRELVIQKLFEAQPTIQASTKIEVGTDERDKKRDAVENAILHRVMPSQFELSASGREMRGMDLIRMATVLTGNQYGSDSEIATRAMTTSDLPLILASVAEKSVQKSYEVAPSTFEKFVNQRTLKNYKVAHQVKGGEFPELKERLEEGEFIEGSFSEGEETVQLKKYGRILSMSEEMIVNDDLGMLADFLTKAGAAAKRLESKLVYDRLQAATNMSDGSPLFHANHGNLGTAGAISETTFDELIQKLKNQKGLDAQDYLDLQAAYLICGIQNETAARKFLSTIIPNATSSVNPFANSVELIVDPRITSKNWFLSADKSRIDSVVLYRLLGKEKPVVSTRNKWETGAFQIKVEHVAAAQAMEHRGIVKNPYT